MKKILFTLIMLTTVVYAQDLVKVTGDRVSLRAAPDINAVLVDRAMKGDELTLKDNSNPKWVGVLPPDSIDLWVSTAFVSNNVVVPDLLNIRSGPSLSHHLVGTASKGDLLTVRGEVAGWTKIAPTSNTVIWISRTYVEAPEPPPVAESAANVIPPVVVEPVAAAVSMPETQAVVQVVAEPTLQDVMTAMSSEQEHKLMPDPAKEQGVEGTYSGVLQPMDDLLYKLVDLDNIVCYVRGNSQQMKNLSDMKLEISGKTYWAAGKDLPVVVPATIKPFVAGK